MPNVLDPVADVVVAAYRNGESYKSIANVHGCSPGTVRNLLISRGEPRKPKGRPKGSGKKNGAAAVEVAVQETA
jgi:hypothetical protein